MRPVELTIEGLRSFRHQQTITFADRELVAIIGDTGAGKSSILEALTWALYGNTTWTKRATVLLGDDCVHMRVRCVFDADGNRWQVTRAVRRRQDGTPGPASAELRCLDGDRPTVDRVRQVDQQIEQILGLNWDAFIRTVVLPQGQFARLLTETDVNRLQTLKQIWRTDNLVTAREYTDDAHRQLTAHLAELRGRRREYPADVAAELDQARTQHQQAQHRAEQIDQIVDQANNCRDRITNNSNRAQQLRTAAARLTEQLDRDPVTEADRLADLARGIDSELAGTTDAITARQQQVSHLEGPPSDGGPGVEATNAAVTTLQQLAATTLTDRAEDHSRIAKLDQQAQQAKQDAARLADEATRAEQKVTSGKEHLESWQRADYAATAAHNLQPGDNCPVCAQLLPESWSPPDTSGLEAAKTAADKADTDAQQARSRHSSKQTEAENLAQQARDETTRLDEQLRRIVEEVAGLPEPFRPNLPCPFTTEELTADQITDALVTEEFAAARTRKKTLDGQTKQLEQARGELQRLREVYHDLRERRRREVTEPASQLRDQLRRLGERVQTCIDQDLDITPAVPEPREPLDEFAADMRTAVQAGQSAATVASQAASDAETAADRDQQTLETLLTRAEVETAEQLDQQRITAHTNRQQAEQRVEDLQKMQPKVDALDAHLVTGDTAGGALADLKTVLQDGRFIRWLTLRRSRNLLAAASTLLEEMTGGRYLFADITDENDEWRVFDTHTGYARSPKTLSGGESFIASLALALGMVEMVARSGGRLDALFLDEGFGSLDRDNLDAAVSALESSATRGRMVGVISHVQAVAERLDHVLAVDRAPHGTEARWLTSSERDSMAATDATTTVRNLLT